MRCYAHGLLRRQVNSLRRQFLQQDGLPFADVFPSAGLEVALREVPPGWRDRIFNPLITLWVFLGKVLNTDQSCRAAVVWLIAHRDSLGLEPCSSKTGAYCQARKPGPAAEQLPAHTRIMHRLAADAKGRQQADGVTAKQQSGCGLREGGALPGYFASPELLVSSLLTRSHSSSRSMKWSAPPPLFTKP